MEKRLHELEQEVARLKKVNQTLIERALAKQSGDGAFKIFEKNALLSDQVRQRTHELELATEELTNERNVLDSMVAALPGTLLFFTHGKHLSKVVNLSMLYMNTQDELLTLETSLGYVGEFILNKLDELTSERNLVIFNCFVKNHPALSQIELSISTKDLNSFVVFIQDRSEAYMQEEKIKSQEAQIMQSSKLAALGEMAGGVAHEINNPLAIIHSSVAILDLIKKKHNLEIPKYDDAIRTIEATVTRISKIVNGMRNLSREAKDFQKKEMPLNTIVEEVLSLCGDKFKNHGVTFRNKISEKDLSPNVLCDHIQLSQVILNLFNNSYDAILHLEDKWIEIDFESQDNEDYILITDCGAGIPSHIVDKMFSAFYTSKEIGKGTGLGLSISKTIMEKHGGSITVDQTYPHTRFILRLPSSSQAESMTA